MSDNKNNDILQGSANTQYQSDLPLKCKTFDVYEQRWYVLFSFSLLSMSSSWIWITWSPITNVMSQYWNVPIGHVDNLMGIYMYVYVTISFVSLYCVVNFLGLKYGLVVGGIFNALGATIRYLYRDNYSTVYIGTLICALAQTFTLSTPPLLASNWFPSHERATATGIGILANQLGTAIGLGITTSIDFSSNNSNFDINIITDDIYSNSTINEAKLKWYLAIQLAVSVTSLLLLIVFGADQPPTPPSHAAAMLLKENSNDGDNLIKMDRIERQQNVENSEKFTNDGKSSILISEITPMLKSKSQKIHQQYLSDDSENETTIDIVKIDNSEKFVISPTYTESLRLLLLNRDQLSFIVGFGTSIGVFYTIPTILSQITPPDWSSHINGWIGLLYQFTGVCASYFAGRRLDSKTFLASRNNRHHTLAMIFLCGSFASLVVLLIGSYAIQSITVARIGAIDYFAQSAPTNTYIIPFTISTICIVVGIVGSGMCLAAFNTIAIEYGTGLVFPANETAVTGVYETSAELFGFLWVTICGIWIEASHVTYVFFLLLGAITVSMERFYQIRNAVIKRPSG